MCAFHHRQGYSRSKYYRYAAPAGPASADPITDGGNHMTFVCPQEIVVATSASAGTFHSPNLYLRPSFLSAEIRHHFFIDTLDITSSVVSESKCYDSTHNNPIFNECAFMTN